MATIVCMKWGTKYGPEYVRRLRAMVQRQLVRPHRFVCFTDQAAGLGDGVEVRPLPAVKFPPGPERGWLKLGVFSPEAGLSGPTLFLDLDLVVMGPLDPFFEHPGKFCIIRDWLRGDRGVGNSSVFRFEGGQYENILRQFEADPAAVMGRVRNEQEYLSEAAAPVTFWPGTWCFSFKRHCLPKFPRCYWQTPQAPADAKIVVFHGFPKPEEAVRGASHKFGLRHTKPTPWIATHWRE